jgi:hypothetical protein
MTQHHEEGRRQVIETLEVSLPMGGRAGVVTQYYNDEEEYPQDEVEEEESLTTAVRRTEVARTRAETRMPNGSTIQVIEEVEYDDGTRQERIGGGRGWRGPREDPPEH